MKAIKYLLVIPLFVLVACDQASDTVVNIPNVNVSCTTTDDPNCSTANANPSFNVFVVYSRSGCASQGFDSPATGSAPMNCDADGCSATISSWTDPDTQESVGEFISDTFDICSYVDLDNSTTQNTGDLVREQSKAVSNSSAITVDTWD